MKTDQFRIIILNQREIGCIREANMSSVNNAQALTRVGGIPFSKQAMDLIKRAAPEEKKEKKKKTKATRSNF